MLLLFIKGAVIFIIGIALIILGVYAFLCLTRNAKPSEMKRFDVMLNLFGRNIPCGLVYYVSSQIVAIGMLIIAISCIYMVISFSSRF